MLKNRRTDCNFSIEKLNEISYKGAIFEKFI